MMGRIRFLAFYFDQIIYQMFFFELTYINRRAILSDTGELAQAG